MYATARVAVWVLIFVGAMLGAPRSLRAEPAAKATFRGAAYERPDGWTEQDQGATRVLIAPHPRAGEALLVIVSAQFKAIQGPVSDIETLARQAEQAAIKATHGPVGSNQAGGFTFTTMTAKVEDRSLGTSSRLYELVSNATDEVFVAVVSRGDATFADHRDALQKLLVSCHPTSGAASPTSRETPPRLAGSAPATAVPYADTPGKVPGDPEFRPSGKGKPIPEAAIVDGAPRGLWWTYTTTGNPTAYGTVFFPDGMALHYYRPGGPNLADLDGMRANQGAGDIGTWSLANGQISIHFGELHRSVAFSVQRDRDGVFWRGGTQIYRPATPLTAKALVGTWQIPGIGEFAFAADGTVQTTIGMIGSVHGLNYTDGKITGTWLLDGYLLAMSFPGEGVRVLPVFAVSGAQIVITSRFYMRK